MFKYIFGVLVLIAGALLWMVFGIGAPAIYQEAVRAAPVPHLAGDPKRSIERIHIYGFYFAPKDKSDIGISKKLLTKHLDALAQFHALQFRGRSEISYSMYPTAVVGYRDAFAYDTNDTSGGNPRALINVAQELEARVFRQDGDLYDASFAKKASGVYPVMAIFYDGVGASGGIIYDSELETAQEIAQELGIPQETIFILDVEAVDGFFLLNKDYLTGALGAHGVSFLAHEFYHTLGVPDAYLAPKSIPTSPDIMGLGRLRALEKTYIERATLKSLGL